VINNLAIIDYTKCTNCGDCVIACPRKIIIQEKTPVKKEPAGEKKEEAKEDKK
jgi:Fe-S-cluster-containing hydrogenase component 2